MNKEFKIGEKNKLQIQNAESNDIVSTWSPGKVLKGYKFSLQIDNKHDYEYVKNSFEGMCVVCEEDGFSGIVSKVITRQTVLTDGEFVSGNFEIVISEKDIKPVFSEVIINGFEAKVVDYKADIDSRCSKHTFNIDINRNDLIEFRKRIFKAPQSINFIRIGVDEEPIKCRLGGRNIWSNSNEDGKVQHIVRCVIDTKKERPTPIDLASDIRLANLEKHVFELKVKMDFLVSRLNGKVLNSEDYSLISDVDALEKETSIAAEYWTSLSKVTNAQDYF